MTGKRLAVVMGGLLVVYLVFAALRGVELIAAGGWVATVLGLAVLVLPLIGLWALVVEWRFGQATQRLGAILAARGELPVDDLPRRPSGRPVREAADAHFAAVRTRVEGDPDSWERWFELSVAYDLAGDRRRARSAMRRAISLHDSV